MKRGKRRAGIPKQDRTDLSDKGRRPHCFCKADTMIAWIRLCQRRKPSAGLPVKLTAVYNNTANRRAMTANELGRRVNYNIRTIFNRPDQIRSCKGIIDYQRNPVSMGNTGNPLNIGYIRIRIPQGFDENRFGILLNRRLYSGIIRRIHKSSRDSILRQGMGKKIIGSSINILCRYNMVTLLCQILKGICNSCCAGSNCQCCNTTLQSGNPPFKYILRRIC